METTRRIEPFRWDARPGSVAVVVALTAAVAACEALFFFGEVWYTIAAYSLLLLVLSLAPLVLKREMTVFQAFALLPVFRLVNLTMPVFFDLTLFWLPFVYGALLPALVYLGWRLAAPDRETAQSVDDSGGVEDRRAGGESRRDAATLAHRLPRWLGGERPGKPRRWTSRGWRSLASPADASRARAALHTVARGLFVVGVAVAGVALLVLLGLGTVFLAEVEYRLIAPPALVPSLDLYYVAVLAVIMVGLVGFVEELLFRGILQQVLELRLGVVPGLVLSSAIFGLMHSGHGVPEAIAFACGVGLAFGILYDVTDSLALVAVLHGALNVLLFGVLPLGGGASLDALRSEVLGYLGWNGFGFVADASALLDVLLVTGPV